MIYFIDLNLIENNININYSIKYNYEKDSMNCSYNLLVLLSIILFKAYDHRIYLSAGKDTKVLTALKVSS